MKTKQLCQSKNSGFALMVTLMVCLVALIVFASILSWAFSNMQVTQQNNQYNMSENAAEAAVERVIGQIDRDFISATISNTTAYTALPTTIDQTSWPIQYVFSDTNGVTGQVSVSISPTTSSSVSLNSQYAGLAGLVQSNDVWATATPVGQRYNVPATVHESVQFAQIPLFQFAIFYNVNLEIDPGQAMTIQGPVFCNQNIWEGSSVCTFNSTVTAAGTNAVQVADPFATAYNGSGTPTFSSTPVNHANQLVMPIGTNNSPGAILGLLNLPPPPYNSLPQCFANSNGIAYPYNGSDLVISNFVCGTNDGNYTPTGTNYIVYFQDQAAETVTPMPYDFFIMTNRTTVPHLYTTNFCSTAFATNLIFAGMSWITNASFYDWREGWGTGSGKRVEAVQIDMGKLNTWLTNQSAPVSGYTYDQQKVLHSSQHIGSVYVYNSVQLTASQLPAVRVMDGAQLPNPAGSAFGFTVATPFPLYVWGNYNSQNGDHSALGQWGTNNATQYTLPAALMGDAITILSTNWQDSYSWSTNSSQCTSGGPNSGSTTVNAAMLEGIVASNPSISGNYSGGVENFLRLLENWNNGPTGTSSKQVLTYNGSIVVLFYSQYATGSWQPTGNYYNPPTRNWAFDLNFKTANKLPPLTPKIRAMIRGNWYAHQ
jgi:Tfp pilus assembly protein PilX